MNKLASTLLGSLVSLAGMQGITGSALASDCTTYSNDRGSNYTCIERVMISPANPNKRTVYYTSDGFRMSASVDCYYQRVFHHYSRTEGVYIRGSVFDNACTGYSL